MPASAPADVPPRAAIGMVRGLTHVAVHDSLVAARPAWDALLGVAPASAYQTPGWIAPWLATLGQGLEPFIVVGSDAAGPVALLPLGVTRRGGLATARFLGGRDSNVGLGLFDPAVTWDAAALRHLLAEAARLGGIDLFWLANQPRSFAGHANPLVTLPAVPSPSLQHETALDGAPDAVLARVLSARARKHLRQKEAKLAALGTVRHEMAADAEAADRIATALLAQREARFGSTGHDEALRAFLRAAATPRPGAAAAVELHALQCGDATVAAFAGAAHRGRFSGMLVSFASEPAWARFSPGELLIARVMVAKARDGSTVFDLGIGEARYKDSFCPTAVPLFDTVLGMTPRGRVAAWGIRVALAAKRGIKQAPRLWAIAALWRGRLRRLSGGLAAPRR